MAQTTGTIDQRFARARLDSAWAFAGVRSNDRWTHGYHRYPAKFLPQLVAKLIDKYAAPDDIVADVFAGCGTTLLEAKIHGRPSVGTDINPVAQLITRAKINPIEPTVLEQSLARLRKNIDAYKPSSRVVLPRHARIDYWFSTARKRQIAFLYSKIMQEKNPIVQDFFLCALSNILKTCSRWLQSSTKPQIDPNKIPGMPFFEFEKQVRRMTIKNKEYYDFLREKKLLATPCKIKLADARSTGIKEGTVGIVVTSPPYVTSYEYADIHQLTGYWFNYLDDLKEFRKSFIGTFYSGSSVPYEEGAIAGRIVSALTKKKHGRAGEVSKYFHDMMVVTKEIKRILKPGGKVCMVVGNTEMAGVRIRSAEACAEMLSKEGFEIENIIRRAIPFKLIPAIRDKKTGRFTNLDNRNKKFVYPEEYIIVAKK